MQVLEDLDFQTAKDEEIKIHSPQIAGIKSPMVRNLSKRKNNGVVTNAFRKENTRIDSIPEPAGIPLL